MIDYELIRSDRRSLSLAVRDGRPLVRAPRRLAKREIGLMGLRPAGITITGARTRFGSCSSKRRISFSFRLMQYPPEAIDYVVVHELAHLRHMNHSAQFYALIEQYMPDYKVRRAMLK